MKKWAISFLVLIQIAWTWTLTLYIRLGAVHPFIYIPQMQEDIEYLGYWALLLDVVVFTALYFVLRPTYRKYKRNKEDASLREPLDNKTDN